MRNVATWALRVLVAILFVLAGLQKFPTEGAPWPRIFELIGFGQWFRYFMRIVEIVGGLLVLVPRPQRLPSACCCARWSARYSCT